VPKKLSEPGMTLHVRFQDLMPLTSLAKATQSGIWSAAPLGTTLGHVHFYVGDLTQAKSFYHHALGLDLITWRYPGALFTSAGSYHHHVGLNT
jgi:catechol 2,3-dioxygenase